MTDARKILRELVEATQQEAFGDRLRKALDAARSYLAEPLPVQIPREPTIAMLQVDVVNGLAGHYAYRGCDVCHGILGHDPECPNAPEGSHE